MLSYKLCRQDFDFLSKLINFLFSRAAAFLGKLKTRAQFYGKKRYSLKTQQLLLFSGYGVLFVLYHLLFGSLSGRYRVFLKTVSLRLNLTGHFVRV